MLNEELTKSGYVSPLSCSNLSSALLTLNHRKQPTANESYICVSCRKQIKANIIHDKYNGFHWNIIFIIKLVSPRLFSLAHFTGKDDFHLSSLLSQILYYYRK